LGEIADYCLINQLTDYLVQDANAGLAIVDVLGVKVLEIRNRGEHHAAQIVHLGVELVRVLVGQVIGGHMVRQDVLQSKSLINGKCSKKGRRSTLKKVRLTKYKSFIH